MKILTTVLVLSLGLTLSACFDIKRYYRGTEVSAGWIELLLEEPMPYREVYPKLRQAASEYGFIYNFKSDTSFTFQEKVADALAPPGESVSSLSGSYWYNKPFLASLSSPAIETSVDPTSIPTTPDSLIYRIVFKYSRGNTESLTLEEWQIIYDYLENILPELFPKAQIDFLKVRHPGQFTDYEVLLEIEEQTDIVIPERIWELKKPK